MNETKQFPESDLPSPSETEGMTGAEEAVMAERLTPLLDRVIDRVEIPTLQEELHLPNPEEVLHKVVEAAEQNQALEKILEMKHEIKDPKTVPVSLGNATPLSQLIQARTSATGLQKGKSQQFEHVGHHVTLSRRIFNGNSLYGLAIRYGFVTAVCSLIVAVLVVWLFT